VIDYYTDEYGVDITSVAGLTDVYFIPDTFYHDVNFRYSFDNDLQITAGVDNVFDKKAPYYKYLDGFFDPTENTGQGTYDTLGRFLYIGVDKKF